LAAEKTGVKGETKKKEEKFSFFFSVTSSGKQTTENGNISRQPNGRLWEERNGKETLEVLNIEPKPNYHLGTSGCDREAKKRVTKEFQKQRDLGSE
jgi:hypothetical protein